MKKNMAQPYFRDWKFFASCDQQAKIFDQITRKTAIFKGLLQKKTIFFRSVGVRGDPWGSGNVRGPSIPVPFFLYTYVFVLSVCKNLFYEFVTVRILIQFIISREVFYTGSRKADRQWINTRNTTNTQRHTRDAIKTPKKTTNTPRH